MKILVAYIIISAIYEITAFIKAYFSFKEYLRKSKQASSIIDAFKQTAITRNIKKKIFNWYTIGFVILPVFLILCPFLFPFHIFTSIRRLIFGKSKVEQAADAESKAYEDAERESEAFMHNEGVDGSPDEPEKTEDGSDCVISIDGEDFELPKPVFILIHNVSSERDAYKKAFDELNQKLK